MFYLLKVLSTIFLVSQLCDKGYLVSFDSQKCLIEHKHDINIKHVGHRVNNVYMIDLSIKQENNHCFLSKDDDPWLWHKRIAHINMDHLNKLISKDLVVGLPKLKFEKDKLCDACQKGKQTRVSFKPKNVVSTTQPDENHETGQIQAKGPSGEGRRPKWRRTKPPSGEG